MPLQQTSGNVTADAYGGGVAAVPNYIEEVFSTWLFNTDTPNDVTIPNGIDLSGEGGLVWNKLRSDSTSHQLYDTERGGSNQLQSNTTNAQSSSPTNAVQFGSNGFTWLRSGGWGPNSVVSWTFRKQPKFFDVVTYTGDGVDGKAISHSLGSVPGCIIVKNVTSGSTNWVVWHRSSAFENLKLNTTAAASGGGFHVYSASSTTFDVYNSSGGAASADFCNASGQSYVAYLFAHNAGGFGLTGTDNVISCGSFTTDASGNPTVVNLGYEPQWILVKKSSTSGEWFLLDTMRGMSMTNLAQLYANQSYAENTLTDGYVTPTATGFNVNFNYLGTSNTCIYIAIRRGPMKVPTDATKVFAPTSQNTGSNPTVTTNFPVDLSISTFGGSSGNVRAFMDRLRGGTTTSYNYLSSTNTSAETTGSSYGIGFASNTSVTDNFWMQSPTTFWNMRRAPSFFDEVCYTGNGTSGTTKNHNLGVVPELVILKDRSAVQEWRVMCAYYNNNVDPWSYRMALNTTGGISGGSGVFNDTAPTASVFTLGNNAEVNASGDTYVAYLFATCAGVSKVFSFTGNGTTQTINCGFTGGARFVLLKATSTTGGWFVYDTARGMTTLTDPYLQLNSTAAESATLGSVTTVSTGFAVNESILTGVNTNGVSYIGLAIA